METLKESKIRDLTCDMLLEKYEYFSDAFDKLEYSEQAKIYVELMKFALPKFRAIAHTEINPLKKKKEIKPPVNESATWSIKDALNASMPKS